MKAKELLGQLHREQDSFPKHMADNIQVAVCDDNGEYYARDFEITSSGGEILIRFKKENNEL